MITVPFGYSRIAMSAGWCCRGTERIGEAQLAGDRRRRLARPEGIVIIIVVVIFYFCKFRNNIDTLNSSGDRTKTTLS